MNEFSKKKMAQSKVTLATMAFALSALALLGCGRSSSDRASITLNTPTGKTDNNNTEKPLETSAEVLLQSERALNLIRFVRNQTLYFYQLKGETFPANNCFKPGDILPQSTWTWENCPIGDTGIATGTTETDRVNGNYTNFTTVLTISPIKTITSPNYGFKIIVSKLNKNDENGGSFSITGDIDVEASIKESTTKETKIYSYHVERFIFVGKANTPGIALAKFTKASLTYFENDGSTTQRSATIINPSTLTVSGATNLLIGNFEVGLVIKNQTFGAQKITFDTTALSTVDNVKRKWECENAYGCLLLPRPAKTSKDSNGLLQMLAPEGFEADIVND